MKKLKIGLIGCGNISEIYCKNFTQVFGNVLDLAACSDLEPQRARDKAKKFNIPRACNTEELLADREIRLVINLTTPPVHTKINLMALKAGKHVYVEKPLALNQADAKTVLSQAKKKNLLIGCAPDTFLGGGLQTCRKIIDDGIIGKPVSAMAFMTCHGHESWHPGPDFYYQPGAGPMLDMGPYYLTALVNFFGPVKRVAASTGRAFTERTITSRPRAGTKIKVNTDTHITGTIDFVSGVIATIVMSFDVWHSDTPFIEVHGTKGSMSVPDPNCFGGPVKIFREGDQDWTAVPITSHGYCDNSRGLGVFDMAYALASGRRHRANGDLAAHVLEVMLAFEKSSKQGRHIKIKSACRQPKALPPGLKAGELDK